MRLLIAAVALALTAAECSAQTFVRQRSVTVTRSRGAGFVAAPVYAPARQFVPVQRAYYAAPQLQLAPVYVPRVQFAPAYVPPAVQFAPACGVGAAPAFAPGCYPSSAAALQTFRLRQLGY